MDLIDGDLGPDESDPPDLYGVLVDFINKISSREDSLDGTRMITKLLRRKIQQLKDLDMDSSSTSGDVGEQDGEQKTDVGDSNEEEKQDEPVQSRVW